VSSCDTRERELAGHTIHLSKVISMMSALSRAPHATPPHLPMCCAVVLQVIANTGGVLGMGGTPHEVLARAGKAVVDVDKVPFKGPKTPHAKWHKVRSCRGPNALAHSS
jgi:hypothetical protein